MRKPLGTEAANTSSALYTREANRSLSQLANVHCEGLKDAFGWTPGGGDGQGGLTCCASWGCKESDTTE